MSYKENYKLIDWSKELPFVEHVVRDVRGPRSRLSGPMVINDQCEVRSMVDGKIYTSKSLLRASYVDNPTGERYIEVGNSEQKIPEKPKPDRKAIRDSLGKAFYRAGIPVDG